MECQQVSLVNNWKVGPPGSAQTFHYNSKTRRRDPVPTYLIVPCYIKPMCGVEMFDQSMHGHNVSLGSNRWYLWAFYYTGNVTLANMRINTKPVVQLSKGQHGLDRRKWPRCRVKE